MTQMDEKALYHLDQVGIRIVKERELFSEKPIENPEAAIQVVADALQDYDRELFCVVNLQSDMRPINMNIMSMGVLNQALVHPREVLKSAILSNAASVLLFHNHPSQNVKPSREDIAVTDQLIQACALIGIPVTDHIIVGNAKEYYSFKNHGRLPIPNLQFADDESKLDFHAAGTESRKSVRKNLKDNQRKGAAEGLNTESRRKRVNKEQVL